MIPGAAKAQRVVSTVDRSRLDCEPMGIRAGAFTINPHLTLCTEYNDNIYAARNDTKSGWIISLSPEVDVQSNWSRHSLKLNAELDPGQYASESKENFMDSHIFMDGRVDMRRESFFRARAGYQHLHEERGSMDVSETWDEPAVYNRTQGKISYYHGLNRFSLTAGAAITTLSWQRVALKEGGSQCLNIKDRNLYNINARIAYELHPDVHPFITTTFDWRHYDKPEAMRDSRGYRIGIGTGFGITGTTSGEVFGGYMLQDYDDRDKISGAWYGMSLLWNLSRLTSIEARAESSVIETTRVDSSGVSAVETKISIDHELLRNLLIGASMDYRRYSYQGEDITDNYYTLGPGLTYLWNRNLSAKAEFNRWIRSSNISDREFTENRFVISITGSF
ncbi:MAG: outer membrane beta-barrel protein [Desulfatiglandales bacterium]